MYFWSVIIMFPLVSFVMDVDTVDPWEQPNHELLLYECDNLKENSLLCAARVRLKYQEIGAYLKSLISNLFWLCLVSRSAGIFKRVHVRNIAHKNLDIYQCMYLSCAKLERRTFVHSLTLFSQTKVFLSQENSYETVLKLFTTVWILYNTIIEAQQLVVQH